jgi:hypothetical protein
MHRHWSCPRATRTFTVVLGRLFINDGALGQQNRAHVYHRQGIAVETAQLRQCKYEAASSKVYKGFGIKLRIT